MVVDIQCDVLWTELRSLRQFKSKPGLSAVAVGER
jgi:hypothetical protein